MVGPDNLYTSARMASEPGALPVDICLMALLTSSAVGEAFWLVVCWPLGEICDNILVDMGRSVKHAVEVFYPSFQDQLLVG